MTIETPWGVMNRARVDAILQARVADPRASLDPFGLCESDWPEFVSAYEDWIDEGKRRAEYTVAYGSPHPGDDTPFLLSLVIPYARALRSQQAVEDELATRGELFTPAYASIFGANAKQLEAESIARKVMR